MCLALIINLYDRHQAINLALFEQFQNRGIEFAYPTQMVVFDNNVSVDFKGK
jgi:hypothetical protein